MSIIQFVNVSAPFDLKCINIAVYSYFITNHSSTEQKWFCRIYSLTLSWNFIILRNNVKSSGSYEHTDTFPIWKQSPLHGAERRRGSISSADAAGISENSKTEKYQKIVQTEKYRNIAATEKSKYQKVSENIGNRKSKASNAHFLHHASENSKRKHWKFKIYIFPILWFGFTPFQT